MRTNSYSAALCITLGLSFCNGIRHQHCSVYGSVIEVDRFCREVRIEDGKDPIVCLEQKLGKLDRDVRLEVGSPVPAETNCDTAGSTKEVYWLLRWSSRWDCFVDVMDANQVADGDKLTAVCRDSRGDKTSKSDSSCKVG